MAPNVQGARSPAWNPYTVPDGKTGYMELLFPWQQPGTGLFKIDENGNVTAASFSEGSFDGPTVYVPAPTGNTASDTPAIIAAIASFTAAVNLFGSAVLMLQSGTYQIDSNTFVIQSVSNFAIMTTGRTTLQQAPNRAGLVNNVTGDIMIIADCSDFSVGPGIVLDGQRDTVAPVTALTATAASGQATVTVAAGSGANYLPGQYLTLFGGINSADSGKTDGFNAASSAPLLVQSIALGAGSGGGDLITFTTNLANTYTAISATLLTDGYGPYGGSGAFLSPYQTGYNISVAGRTGLGSEDMQNGLHLMNCSRFKIDGVTARNIWESPIKLGCGAAISAQGTYANSCYNGIVTGCTGYHAYDQGVSVWVCQYITVSNCYLDAVGWGGVVLTEADYCTVTGCEVKNLLYQSAGNGGGGLVVEGGIRNTFTGNVITAPLSSSAYSGISFQGYPTGGTWGLTVTNTNWPTLGAFLGQGTAAGTSVQVSATSRFIVGGRYSIWDGYRTESVTVATVVDGTHVTFQETTRFAHASGLYISPRLSQENIATGNVIDLTGAQTSADGIHLQGSVRSTISGNHVTGWTNNAISLVAGSGYSPPSSYNGGDGSVVTGNRLGGGANYAISVSQCTRLTISDNQIYGLKSGSQQGISLVGCTDSTIADNQVSDIASGSAIQTSTGGPSSVACARLTIAGNIIERGNGQGILAKGGDSYSISGNVCRSNNGWGIQLQGVTNSSVTANICNSNQSGGITLANLSSTGCTNCRVVNNTTREDGSGQNISNGGTFTQPAGITEAGNSNDNLFAMNELDANVTTQLTVIGAGSISSRNIVSGTIGAA